MRIQQAVVAALPILVSLAACGETSSEPAADAAIDIADDAGVDAPGDAGGDAAPDTGVDTATDAATDLAADAADGSAEPPSLLDQLGAPGPFAVGFREATVMYAPRDRPAMRELRLAVWYPATPNERRGTTYNGIVAAPDVYVDAYPAGELNRPILVYSHGHLGFAEVSSFVCEHLASRGWIVLAPDHTGNTTSSVGQRRQTEIYYLRAWDIGAVLDWLYDPLRAGNLAGWGSETVVVAGHSFGGFTALALAGADFDIETLAPLCYDGTDTSEFCNGMNPTAEAFLEAGLRDDRIDAAVLMAAGDYRLFGPDGIAAIEIPVLELTGGADDQVTNEGNGDPIWAALTTAQRWRFDLPDAPHNAFTTVCSQELGVAFDCDPESPLPLEWQRVVRVVTTAFVEHVLDGLPERIGVLDGSIPVSETAVAIPPPAD
jgi:predicted dienelactone hydrolase